ncbi:hypothetical protein [uncultured Nostoc sp.]|uniref:hypothetical protein n=1 Tax=uncultured Nostoc sp. TaxID=340711 RepID=UPI0035CBD7C5
MGVGWRGNVEPVIHQPDPKINWPLPPHLQGYFVSGSVETTAEDKFAEIIRAVRPYTLLSERKLFSLYSQAKQLYCYLFWLLKMLLLAIARIKPIKHD